MITAGTKYGGIYEPKNVRHELCGDREVTKFFIEDYMVDESDGKKIKYPDGNHVMYYVLFTSWEHVDLQEGDKVRIINIASWNPSQKAIERESKSGKKYVKYKILYSMSGTVTVIRAKKKKKKS